MKFGLMNGYHSAWESPLARMLPKNSPQRQVYRLAQPIPPHDPAVEDHGPVWELVPIALNPLQTLQQRLNLQPDFVLLALSVSASVNTVGGCRVQLYDQLQKRRLMDRGVQQTQAGGSASGYVFLREPYEFPGEDAQLLLVVQNMEAAANQVQVALYGIARPSWLVTPRQTNGSTK